jgi:hypothetical protein
MEEIKTFDDFYEQKLGPYLGALADQGKSAYGWGIASVIFAVLIIPVLAFGLSDAADGLGVVLIPAVLLGTAVSIYNYTKTKDSYEDDYKKKVIEQIITFIHPGLQYRPGICINHTDYINSSLCRGWYDEYGGDDWIGGNYKGINFKCFELEVSRTSTGAYGGDIKVYKGLFFAAPLNVSFSGGTYVWIKGKEQLAASIADERYRMMPMPEVVRVDCRNGEFEKHYSVYTTDVYEAALLIDGQMMQAITNFKKQINRDISLSFVSGVCYVAIPFYENLFEPKENEAGNKEQIKQYFFTVLLILGIIGQLRLDKL